jgi:hypothetical protein
VILDDVWCIYCKFAQKGQEKNKQTGICWKIMTDMKLTHTHTHIHILCCLNNYICYSTCLVTDECHATIMWPREMCDRSIPIIDEFNAPPALILDPNKDDAWAVTWGQFLVWFIPLHQNNLKQQWLSNYNIFSC